MKKIYLIPQVETQDVKLLHGICDPTVGNETQDPNLGLVPARHIYI